MLSTGWVAFEFSAFKLDFHSIMIRAVARALIEGGMYIHIFVLCRLISFEINPNDH